jgi:hypothetical protein
MDAVTQQNASLVEEAAAASASMQDQAAQLAGVVSQFKLDASVARTSTASAPRAVRAAVPATVPARPRIATGTRSAGAAKAKSEEWEEF